MRLYCVSLVQISLDFINAGGVIIYIDEKK